MNRSLRWYDILTVNINWFSLTTRAQTLAPLVVPLLVQQFVGEAEKGTYVGIIRLWALMAAVLTQALMGTLSDRCMHRWGRRRPFIMIGALSEMVVFVVIGLTAGMSGMTGYWILFALYILSMMASNTAHAATQGLMPDLVPDNQRGRFSGVKALFEVPLPIIFVSFVIGKMASAGNLWGVMFTLMGVVLVGMLITMLVPEKQLAVTPPPLDWKPFLGMGAMTAAFTLVILGMGAAVRWLMSFSGDAWFITLLIGLAGMVVAVVLGVILSLELGMGKEMGHNPSFTWWVINRLAFLAAANNISGFMIFFLQEKFSDLAGQKAAGPAATITMFVGLAVMISALPSGWLTDRFGRKLMIAIACCLGFGGTLVVLLANQVAVMCVGAAVVGLGVGLFFSANWALGTSLVPKEHAGRFLGLSNIAGAGAGAIGAYIGGPIADQRGYVILMAIYAAMFLISLVALRWVKDGPVKAA